MNPISFLRYVMVLCAGVFTWIVSVLGLAFIAALFDAPKKAGSFIIGMCAAGIALSVMAHMFRSEK